MSRDDIRKILLKVAKEYAKKLEVTYNTPWIPEGVDIEDISDVDREHAKYICFGDQTSGYNNHGKTYVRVTLNTDPRISVRHKDGWQVQITYSGDYWKDVDYEKFGHAQITGDLGALLYPKLKRRITTLINKSVNN